MRASGQGLSRLVRAVNTEEVRGGGGGGGIISSAKNLFFFNVISENTKSLILNNM